MNFTHKILGSLLLAGSLALVGCGDPVSSAAPLVTGEHQIRALAVDDFFVYWTTQDGSVKRVSRDGGKATTLVTNDQPSQKVAVDDSHVYWSADDGTIARTAKAGGDAEPLVSAGHDSGLALDATHFYFTTSEGTVRQQSKQDATTADLAPAQKVSSDLALDGITLVWSDEVKSSINEILTDTGTANTVVSGQSAPANVAISPSNIYWSSSGDNTVDVALRDGSNVRRIATPTTSHTTAVMGDDAFVYFGGVDGGVNVAPLVGGEAMQFAQGPAGRVVMAMDATSIYWAHTSGGTIFTAPRF